MEVFGALAAACCWQSTPGMRTWGLATVLTLSLTGCFGTEAVQAPAFVADDVRVEVPTGNLRALGGQGEVMTLADEVATDVNGWVAELAGSFGTMLTELSKHEPTSTDGEWRVYGPFDDEDGEDIAFMVRIAGDEASAKFEVRAGRAGSSTDEMQTVFSGDLAETDAARSGSIMLDFDAIWSLEVLRREIGDADDFGGRIEIAFDRELDSKAKTVELDFDGFRFTDVEDDLEYRDEHYRFAREPDGAGEFHFATWGSFDDEGWSGPERERMTVDMVWNANEAGRARGQVLELEGEGDLLLGDIVLEECFDAGFSLTWAEVNEPYRSMSNYSEGDAAACKLDADVFEG